MAAVLRPRTLILFAGDLFFFVFSIWASLALRYLAVPPQALFLEHLVPFSCLFVAWVVVFFIAGLYESRSIILERRAISATLLVAQTVNVVIAALFFFLLPIFGIAPKTVLLIYLAVSFLLVFFWRAFLFPMLGFQRQESTIVVGEGAEVKELVEAIKNAPRAPARIEAVVSPSAAPSLTAAIDDLMRVHRPHFVIADFNDPRVSGAFTELYNYLSLGVRFVDAMDLYEEIFGRVPLSLIDNKWVARNVSRYAHLLYDPLKRLMDIALAGVAGVVSLLLYPFIILAIKAQDGGVVFYRQVRTGENDKPINLLKFRTMTGTDQGAEVLQSKNVPTGVGRVLRRTRLDELPQLWSVVKGDLSFVGPRPEIPIIVAEYERQIPYYGVRHLVRPGLSGWAQLYHDNHPHHAAAVEATREKLSYDLYYLKHRSLLLDLTIALKTIKKLLSRSGV